MGESAFVAWAGEAGLVGDVRHFPILVMMLYGTLTEQLVDQYGEWVAQTIALGRDRNSPFVVVDVPTTIGHDYVAPVSPPRTG